MIFSNIKNLEQIKITPITYFWVFFYICYYILFILFIKYLRLGTNIDLSDKLIHFINFITIPSDLFQFIFFFTFFGILCNLKLLLSLFLSFRKYLLFNVWKLHFYYYNIDYLGIYDKTYVIYNRPYYVKYNKYYHKYVIFLMYFNFKYAYYRICSKLVDLINIIIKNEVIIQWIYKYLEIIIRGIIILGLCIIIGYECIYNHWMLHYSLYYLFFYFIFNLWVRISNYFTSRKLDLDHIIFEMVYGKSDIIYVNLSALDLQYLLNYINNPVILSHSIITYNKLPDHPLICFTQFIKVSSKKYRSQLIANDDFVWFNDFIKEGFEHYDIRKINNKFRVKVLTE